MTDRSHIRPYDMVIKLLLVGDSGKYSYHVIIT